MGEAVSLMEFVKLLLSDDVERARFAADPDVTLSHHGLGDLSPADVHDAVLLVQDTLTVDWAQAYGSGAGGATTPMPPEPTTAPDPLDRWTSEDPDQVAEHVDAAPQHIVPDVDEALFDAPDLHFGH
jgi:hypothetical protein